DAEFLVLDLARPGGAVGGDDALVVALQGLGHRFGPGRVVVDDQDPDRVGLAVSGVGVWVVHACVLARAGSGSRRTALQSRPLCVGTALESRPTSMRVPAARLMLVSPYCTGPGAGRKRGLRAASSHPAARRGIIGRVSREAGNARVRRAPD